MDLAALDEDLNSGSMKPVYLFFGPEAFLKKHYTLRMTEMVPERLQGFNLERLLAEENPVSDIMERAYTMPFAQPPRVIIVQGVDRYSAEDLSEFKDYLSGPNESTCLVLVADKPDFRIGFFKVIKAKGFEINFDPPRGRGLVAWVKNTGAERGWAVTEDAARTLIELAGTDLSNLDLSLIHI